MNPIGLLALNQIRMIEEALMPYRRGGFALTPPSMALFFVSLALAIVAFLMRYGGVHVAIVNSSYLFEVLAIAYVLLVIGVLFRRV
jgi:hypothetical protein